LPRYRLASDPEHLTTLQVADTWITHIAFAKWKWINNDPCTSNPFPGYHLIHVVDELEGYLAYSTSDGAIGLVKVTQELHEIKEDIAAYTPRYKIALRVECVEEDVFAAERAAIPMGITALKWVGGGIQHEVSPIVVDGNNRCRLQIYFFQFVLFASTPGMVRLWCRFPSSPSTTCTRTHALRIPTRTPDRRKISADSSSLHPVSGAFYLENEDRLVVVLLDGSLWVVGGLRWMWSTEQEGLELERPRWVSTSLEEEKEKESSRKGKEKESVKSSGLNSEALSSVSRAIFQVLENEKREKEKGAVVDKGDMCRINSAVDYDGDGVMSWVYECVLFSVFLSFPCSFKPHFFSRIG